MKLKRTSTTSLLESVKIGTRKTYLQLKSFSFCSRNKLYKSKEIRVTMTKSLNYSNDDYAVDIILPFLMHQQRFILGSLLTNFN